MVLGTASASRASSVAMLVVTSVLGIGCGDAFSTGPGGAGAAPTGVGAAGGGGGATTSSTTTSSLGGSTTTTPDDGGLGGSGGNGPWPGVVVIATGQAGPWGITVDPSNVYWTNEMAGTIAAMPTASGGASVLSALASHPRGIADWAGIVAWADPGRDQACRCAVATCQPSCTGPPGGNPEDVALSLAPMAYYTVPGLGVVESWDGTIAAEVATGQASPQGIDVDALHVYWANAGSNQIMRVSINGGVPEEFAATSGPPQHLIVGSLGVFWTVPSLGVVEGRGTGGTPVTLSDVEGEPWDITSDQARVYWTDRALGRVRAAGPGGGDLVTLAAGLGEPLGITVSGSAVYWTDYAAGTIAKADKPQ